MNEKGAYDIVGGGKHALNLAVLRRSVRARETIYDTVGREVAERSVDKLPAIVTLHTFDESMKLGEDIGEEAL